VKNSEDKQQQARDSKPKKKRSSAFQAALNAFAISFLTLGTARGIGFHLKNQKAKRKQNKDEPRFHFGRFWGDWTETLFSGPLGLIMLFAPGIIVGDFLDPMELVDELPEPSETQSKERIRNNNLIILGGSAAVAVATYFIVRNREKEKAALKPSTAEQPAEPPTKSPAEKTAAEAWSTRVKAPASLAMVQGA
jgi:hypothetical protein